MSIKDVFMEMFHKNEKECENFQIAVGQAVAVMIYSKYIYMFKKKEEPVPHVLIPTIRSIKDITKSDSEFVKRINDELVDKFINHQLIKRYINQPEFAIFKDENIQLLQIVLKIFSNKNGFRVDDKIQTKFGLNNNNNYFREDRNCELFKDNKVQDEYFDFVVDQAVLQYLALFSNQVSSSYTLKGIEIEFTDVSSSLISIDNPLQLFPLFIDSKILNNEKMMNIIEFITVTELYKYFDPIENCTKVTLMKTSPKNKLQFYVLKN